MTWRPHLPQMLADVRLPSCDPRCTSQPQKAGWPTSYIVDIPLTEVSTGARWMRVITFTCGGLFLLWWCAGALLFVRSTDRCAEGRVGCSAPHMCTSTESDRWPIHCLNYYQLTAVSLCFQIHVRTWAHAKSFFPQIFSSCFINCTLFSIDGHTAH